MSQNTEKIRQRLKQMDINRVKIICFDYFPEVYKRLRKGIPDLEVIELLMTAAVNQNKLDKLSELIGVVEKRLVVTSVLPRKGDMNKNVILLIVLVSIIVLVGGIGWFFLPKSVVYTGKVLSSVDYQPVVGAKVSLEPGNLIVSPRYTDNEGKFRFELELPSSQSSAQVIIEARNYKKYSRNTTLADNLEEIRLEPEQAGALLPSSTPTETPTPQPTPTNTPVIPIVSPTLPSLPTDTPSINPTHTSTQIVTVTPLPQVNTVVPTAVVVTPISSATPLPTVTMEKIATSEVTTTTQFPTPTLLSPNGSEVLGETPFSWQWAGDKLPDGYFFEVRIWHLEDNGHFGAHDAKNTTKMVAVSNSIYTLTFSPESAYSVQQHGVGKYQWSVAIVTFDPDITIVESTPYPLQINLPNGGGSNSDSTSTQSIPPLPN